VSAESIERDFFGCLFIPFFGDDVSFPLEFAATPAASNHGCSGSCFENVFALRAFYLLAIDSLFLIIFH